MSQAVSFLTFDTEIRPIICTTNAIESATPRVPSLGQGPRPLSQQAALKHLYLVIASLGLTGRGRKRWSNRWKAAQNAFDIIFDGRLNADRK